MPNEWYVLEFTVETTDGQVHTRRECYPTRTQAAIAMHKEISMGEWDMWRMTRRSYPRLVPETRP
jgi:hypothetical protein